MSRYDWDWLRGRFAEVLRERGHTELPIPQVRATQDADGTYRYTVYAPPDYPENVPLWCFGEIAVAVRRLGRDETVAATAEMMADHPDREAVLARIRAAFNRRTPTTPSDALREYKAKRRGREDVGESIVMVANLAQTPEAAEAVRRGKVSINTRVLAED